MTVSTYSKSPSINHNNATHVNNTVKLAKDVDIKAATANTVIVGRFATPIALFNSNCPIVINNKTTSSSPFPTSETTSIPGPTMPSNDTTGSGTIGTMPIIIIVSIGGILMIGSLLLIIYLTHVPMKARRTLGSKKSGNEYGFKSGAATGPGMNASASASARAASRLSELSGASSAMGSVSSMSAASGTGSGSGYYAGSSVGSGVGSRVSARPTSSLLNGMTRLAPSPGGGNLEESKKMIRVYPPGEQVEADDFVAPVRVPLKGGVDAPSAADVPENVRVGQILSQSANAMPRPSTEEEGMEGMIFVSRNGIMAPGKVFRPPDESTANDDENLHSWNNRLSTNITDFFSSSSSVSGSVSMSSKRSSVASKERRRRSNSGKGITRSISLASMELVAAGGADSKRLSKMSTSSRSRLNLNSGSGAVGRSVSGTPALPLGPSVPLNTGGKNEHVPLTRIGSTPDMRMSVRWSHPNFDLSSPSNHIGGMPVQPYPVQPYSVEQQQQTSPTVSEDLSKRLSNKSKSSQQSSNSSSPTSSFPNHQIPMTSSPTASNPSNTLGSSNASSPSPPLVRPLSFHAPPPPPPMFYYMYPSYANPTGQQMQMQMPLVPPPPPPMPPMMYPPPPPPSMQMQMYPQPHPGMYINPPSPPISMMQPIAPPPPAASPLTSTQPTPPKPRVVSQQLQQQPQQPSPTPSTTNTNSNSNNSNSNTNTMQSKTSKISRQGSSESSASSSSSHSLQAQAQAQAQYAQYMQQQQQYYMQYMQQQVVQQQQQQQLQQQEDGRRRRGSGVGGGNVGRGSVGGNSGDVVVVTREIVVDEGSDKPLPVPPDV
ncbi:hypothetical protein HDU76_010384 [Blyttiomyces sp. JEL0837]|nr:hypothetical protein HDU76_010384 [Blyttiomyces sp. JEL0837]